MSRSTLLFAVVVFASCSASAQTLDASNSAQLAFSRSPAPGGISGTFDSVDGKPLESRPLSIRIAQGSHAIGYSCPDVISVDHQAIVTASFVAGRNYVLDCSAHEPGTVREQ